MHGSCMPPEDGRSLSEVEQEHERWKLEGR